MQITTTSLTQNSGTVVVDDGGRQVAWLQVDYVWGNHRVQLAVGGNVTDLKAVNGDKKSVERVLPPKDAAPLDVRFIRTGEEFITAEGKVYKKINQGSFFLTIDISVNKVYAIDTESNLTSFDPITKVYSLNRPLS